MSQIIIANVNVVLPDTKVLFKDLTLTCQAHKIGLVGRNGVGKSTLLKLIRGELLPQSGAIKISATYNYLPQNLTATANINVAEFLGFSAKIAALQRIKAGSVDEQDYLILQEQWDIEQQLQQQLAIFDLQAIPADRLLTQLSGGELTRLYLTKIFTTPADFLLLDEPTNHLDQTTRQQLYAAIKQWKNGMLVISHDRMLLNLVDEIIELTTLGANCYGGNYEFYAAQKALEQAAHDQQLQDAKKLLRKTQQTIQGSREKHAQKQSYGRKLREGGSTDKLSANAAKGRSERTQSKMLIKQERLTEQANSQLQSAKGKIEITDHIDVSLPATKVPNGKIILNIERLYFHYQTDRPLLQNFNLSLQGPERVALAGANGAGKTTLIKLILGKLTSLRGTVFVGTDRISYLDQHVSLLHTDLSVLENFKLLNPAVQESIAHRSLAQFLFKNVTALKQVKNLSGGEKLRAALACSLMAENPPQLLILDEPTNHLDLSSIASIESALKNYQGAILVISHDQHFLNNINVTKIVSLEN